MASHNNLQSLSSSYNRLCISHYARRIVYVEYLAYFLICKLNVVERLCGRAYVNKESERTTFYLPVSGSIGSYY